ncbi:MAG: NAD(+) synthase [Clostridia bacterium]
MLKYGFVRMAAATPHIGVADTCYNAASITEQILESDKLGCAAVVFPELCITGYTAGDLFLQSALQKGAVTALEDILRDTQSTNVVAIVGLPLAKDGTLYNCAAVIKGGKLLGVVPKANVPNYGEFYELRHFAPASRLTSTIDLFGQKIPFGTQLLFPAANIPAFVLAVEICEDLWVCSPPSTKHCEAGATVIANLSASNEIVGKCDYRRMLVISQSTKLNCAYVYSDAGDGESTTDVVFAGHNMISENGTLLAESKLFENGIITADVDVEKLTLERIGRNTFEPHDVMGYTVISLGDVNDAHCSRSFEKHPFVPGNDDTRAARCEEILTMQAHGLKSRIEHINAKKLVIGISGGLDSTLALLVCTRAMQLCGRDKRDILAVTMPCFGTSERTHTNAKTLCDELGVSFMEINIAKSVLQHLEDIGHDVNVQDVTYENAQARERTQVLMDLANKTNGMVIGTGDLSELALGFATYNGDHMSMYNVNGSIPKTLARSIIDHCASAAASSTLHNVLLGILHTPISPELLPGNNAQITEDIVGPYELHDFFIYNMLRFGFSPEKIFFMACRTFANEYDRPTIKKWMIVFYRRFFSQQFKRSCMPDGPKVGSVTLSPRGDWRMPSDAASRLWLDEAEAL